MKNKVELSILIPAYNDTKSLVRALDSLKSQTIAKQLVVLISDDCSPKPIDIKKINYFKDEFYKFSFIRQETNLGILSNPAWLFNQVETNFFTILQHDDVIIRKDFYEDALKKLINFSNFDFKTMSSVDFFHLSSQPFSCLKTKPSGFPKSPKPTSSGLILCKSERISIILKLIFLKFSF